MRAVIWRECPYCDEKFVTWDRAKEHLKFKHPLEKQVIIENMEDIGKGEE